MGFLHTPAIILAHTKWGETDLMVDALTPQYGRIRGIARRARQFGNPLASALEPHTYSELHGYERGHDPVLQITQAHPVLWFPPLQRTQDRLAAAGLFFRTIRMLSPERDPHAGLYPLAFDGLQLLCHTSNPLLSGLLLRLRCPAIGGYGLALDHCDHCGHPFSPGPLFIGRGDGTTRCRSCGPPLGAVLTLTPSARAILRWALTRPIAHLDHVQASKADQELLEHYLKITLHVIDVTLAL